jgi:hypothetical protein
VKLVVDTGSMAEVDEIAGWQGRPEFGDRLRDLGGSPHAGAY